MRVTGYLILELLNIFMAMCCILLLMGTAFVIQVTAKEWFNIDIFQWIEGKLKRENKNIQ